MTRLSVRVEYGKKERGYELIVDFRPALCLSRNGKLSMVDLDVRANGA